MTTTETTLEKWESITRSTVWVNKFDPVRPGAIKQERVAPGRSFFITAEERNLLNTDRVIDEAQDPFKNGMLRPMMADARQSAAEQERQLAEEARRSAAPNPNHMSDDELAALFEIRNFAQFKKAVGEITSKAILQRLRSLSENEEYNATVSMVKLIDDLIGEADQSEGPEVVEVDQHFRVGGAAEDDRVTGVQPFRP